jgi:hypothetical protein
MDKLSLGDTVSDKVSGFTGVITSITQYIWHLALFGVTAKSGNKTTAPVTEHFHAAGLERVYPDEGSGTAFPKIAIDHTAGCVQ